MAAKIRKRKKPGPLVDSKGPGASPVQLLKDLQNGRVDKADLTTDQRRAILMVLANGSMTSAELGEVLGVSGSTIRNDMQKLREKLGQEVKEWDLTHVLGDMVHSAEKYAAMAVKQEDPGLAWTIKRDLYKLLKEFGVIEPTGRDSLTVTIEAMGDGYNHVRKVLREHVALDPVLTGEVIDVEADPIALPLQARSPAEPEPEDDPTPEDEDQRRDEILNLGLEVPQPWDGDLDDLPEDPLADL